MPSLATRMKSLTRAWRDSGSEEPSASAPDTSERKALDRWERMESLVELSPHRNGKYKEYEEMDREITEISSALDLYADFIVSGGSASEDDVYTLAIEGGPVKANKVAKDFEMRTGIKNRVWFLSRGTAKYGDFFYEVVVDPNEVVKLVNLPSSSMWVNKDDKGNLIQAHPYVQKEFDMDKKGIEFEPWEIVHFKVGEEDYGVDESVLQRCRRTYKIVRMLEDAILVNRITKAHQRLVFKVDVSNMGTAEGYKYIEKLKSMYKSRRFMDNAGNLRTEKNPLQPQEDIWLPVRKDRSTGIDVISADASVAHIADLEHFHNKLFAGTKVPKAYLGFERDVNAKATLTQQHLAFTKVVRRYRHVLAIGLRHFYKVEFLMKGLDPNSFEWKFKFPGLGSADDELTWSIEAIKANVVATYAQTGLTLPIEWILKNVFMDLSPTQVEELMKMWEKDEPCLGGVNPLKPQPDPMEMMMAQAQAQAVAKGGSPDGGGNGKEKGNGKEGGNGQDPKQAIKKATVGNLPGRESDSAIDAFMETLRRDKELQDMKNRVIALVKNKDKDFELY